MKRYFITGTDTDCGKTYVTTQLLKSHPQSAAIKPIASGCILKDGHLVSPDGVQLQQHSSTPLILEQITPWRMALPVSPHIAAAKEKKYINIDELSNYCLNFSAPGIETLFIEGAGGLMVPLNPTHTWLDFLKQTQLPVILVVGIKLGCINHAQLTEMALLSHHIPIAGWVANCLEPLTLMQDEIVQTLEGVLKSPLMKRIPYDAA